MMQSIAIQVSDTMFCELGPCCLGEQSNHLLQRTKSCLLQRIHLYRYKDYRGHLAKGEQAKTKSMYIHVAFLISCLVTEISTDESTTSNISEEELSPDVPANYVSNKQKRLVTLSLAEKVKKLPYVLSHDLLQSIAHRDACTLLGGDTGGEGWPDNFTPDLENCQFLWFSVR